MLAVARARPAGARSPAASPMAENMPSGTATGPRDVLDHARRQHRRGAQHRRRGPADPGRRDRRGPCEDGPDASSTSPRSPARSWSRSATRVTGVMGNDDGLRDAVVRGGRRGRRGGSGRCRCPTSCAPGSTPRSRIWRTSRRAVRRHARRRVFLAEFVPDGLPWVHLDIAGPAFNTGGARDYTPKGGTGAGVRTIIAAVERFAGS